MFSRRIHGADNSAGGAHVIPEPAEWNDGAATMQ